MSNGIHFVAEADGCGFAPREKRGPRKTALTILPGLAYLSTNAGSVPDQKLGRRAIGRQFVASANIYATMNQAIAECDKDVGEFDSNDWFQVINRAGAMAVAIAEQAEKEGDTEKKDLYFRARFPVAYIMGQPQDNPWRALNSANALDKLTGSNPDVQELLAEEQKRLDEEQAQKADQSPQQVHQAPAVAGGTVAEL